jgi:UPF0716 protein FxsA
MFGILVLLFTIIPAIEIYLLINIGGALGAVNTLIIVITTGIVGATLAKSQGLAIINKIQKDIGAGQLPADQIIHGLLVFGGGLLLLTPGFLTDILGLSMVFPGTRHLIVIFAKSALDKGIKNGNIHFTTFGQNGFGGGFSTSTRHQQNDFETEYTELKEKPDKIDNVIEVDFMEKNERND